MKGVMIFLTVNTKLKKPERNIIFLGNITEACQLSNILATTVLNNFPCKPVILETYLTQQNWSLFKDRSKKFKVKKYLLYVITKKQLHCGNV